ncbi:MAG: sigma-54-dependent transcriptional regulator [Sediminispirochaetaceae bacterium]
MSKVKNMSTVLIIDDDSKEHSILTQVLSAYRIESVHTAEEALDQLTYTRPDVVLLGIEIRGVDGFDLLSKILSLPDNPPVIVMSTRGDTACIVKAIKYGAYNYLCKPYDAEQLLSLIRECIASRLMSYQDAAFRIKGPEDRIIGSSRIMEILRKKLSLYADTNLPVLITGESGSGKELAARTIHLLSNRRDGSYRTVHCGAIPLTLFEAELYGSECGAFTGAVRRPGYFEQAHRGSLFLDEIGEMPLEGQVKLLRILEDREIIRVGGHRKVHVDVRIISATNRDLAGQVRQGKFRSDLFYRINTLHVNLPPLRDHPQDIPELSRSILHSYSDAPVALSREAQRKLMKYHWPGNVRELRNVLTRAAVQSGGGKIEAYHIQVLETGCEDGATAAIS